MQQQNKDSIINGHDVFTPIENIQFELMFQFQSQSQWENNTKEWFSKYRQYKDQWICLDINGNLCFQGEDFTDARRNALYPVTVYRLIRTHEALLNSGQIDNRSVARNDATSSTDDNQNI